MKSIKINSFDIIFDESERYLQINDISEPDIRKVWDSVISRYAIFNIMFCYHNAETPIHFLKEIGAVIVDDSIEMRISQADFIPDIDERYNIILLAASDFSSFAAFHDDLNPEMYWTSKRIISDFGRWRIFTIKLNDKIKGYIMIMVRMNNPRQAEIFALTADDFKQRKSLLSVAITDAFNAGKDEIIYMPDENTPEKEAALAVGFRVSGFYQGYKWCLPNS